MTKLLISFVVASLLILADHASGANLTDHVEITWGDGRGEVSADGEILTLTLDEFSGSGFESTNEYLFGKISVQLKLVPGNSAGTVTAFYLSSLGVGHDEIDFEFLGNSSGEPYLVHTNVFVGSVGNREQQFYLGFDPAADFHTYTILWNPKNIIFSVDGSPIRVFKNGESVGVPYPKKQAMRIYSSLWNADDWATRGGLVKTDWSQAPFAASYRNYSAEEACVSSSGGAASSSSSSSSSSCASGSWMEQQIDEAGLAKIQSFQKQHMVYDYCKDQKRFPQGLPPECEPAESN